MSSAQRRALISLLILASTPLALSGCVSGRRITIIPPACSSLIGDSLRADTKPVDLPTTEATAGDLWIAFDGQTGKLDDANRVKRGVLETIQRCEARDAEIAKARPWWKIW